MLAAEVFLELRVEGRTLEAGHVLRLADRVGALGVGPGEHDVELFESPALGLGEPPPDAGDDGSVEDGEDDVGPVSQVLEGRLDVC